MDFEVRYQLEQEEKFKYIEESGIDKEVVELAVRDEMVRSSVVSVLCFEMMRLGIEAEGSWNDYELDLLRSSYDGRVSVQSIERTRISNAIYQNRRSKSVNE